MNVLTPVKIPFDNGTELNTTVWQLLQWKAALRIEIKTGMVFKGKKTVSGHLRHLLNLPRSFPKQQLLTFVTEVLDEIESGEAEEVVG